MDRLKELLQKKVVGVKVLYLALVFVLVLLFMAWRMKNAGVPDDTTDGSESDTEATDNESTGDDSQPGFTATPDPTTGTNTNTGGGDGSSPAFPAEETPDDNAKWGRRAMEWLHGHGATVDQATSAIQKYLDGDQLSYSEGLLRDKAVNQFGYPPDIPVSGGTASKPPAKNTKNTPTQKPPLVYTVVAGGPRSYSGLAQKFYGSSAATYIDLIQAANTKLGHSAPKGGWKNGTRVFIPAKRTAKYYTANKGHLTAASIASANGISVASLHELNDTVRFPVKSGKKVRVA